MRAAALNHLGTIEGDEFGSIFAKTFADFKVIKLMPVDELKTGPLELCEPVIYKELIKDIQKTGDETGTFLELTGLKAKLQRAVRQMFFFDEGTKFNNILLHGCDGINDFPWAIQIALVQLPVLDWKKEAKIIRRSDVLIIKESAGEEIEDSLKTIKKLCPNISIYVEKLQDSLSQELQENLKALFSVYEDKRSRVKDALKSKYPDQIIGCEQARGMARKLRVNPFLFGNVCDECGYRVTRCGLGCF